MSTENNEEGTGGNEAPVNPPAAGQETPAIIETPAGQEETPGNNDDEKDDPKWLKKILEPLAGAVTTLSQKQSETMDELRTMKADLAEMKAAKSTPPASQEAPQSGTNSQGTNSETSSETKTEAPKESVGENQEGTGLQNQLQKVRREILKL